jgi:hypothetical protein
MAIISLKAWYIEEYEPIKQLQKRPYDLRLSKNSLLKSALRADFLDEPEVVQESAWFQRYLEGDAVEFYIEGSGGYAIANIDLSSHEIYFTKQDVLAHLEPVIFFAYQQAYAESSELLRDELVSLIETINRKSRVKIALKESHRLSDGPVKMNSPLMRSIRQSLLFIADGTSIAQIEATTPPQLIPSPQVCVEMGYALQCKRSEQILLTQMERSDMGGHFPFDLPMDQRVLFKDKSSLHKVLPKAVEQALQRFNLF